MDSMAHVVQVSVTISGSQPDNRPFVTVVSEAHPDFRLTAKDDGVVLAYKNPQDPKQHWIKVDRGDKIIDLEGHRGFNLVNKATGKALSHGHKTGSAVTQNASDDAGQSVLWSEGTDLGNGFNSIRAAHNNNLNLDAVQEQYGLEIQFWTDKETQKWTIRPGGPQD